MLGPCAACDGDGWDYVDCNECNGTGLDEDGNDCDECDGDGIVEQNCPECDGFGDDGLDVEEED